MPLSASSSSNARYFPEAVTSTPSWRLLNLLFLHCPPPPQTTLRHLRQPPPCRPTHHKSSITPPLFSQKSSQNQTYLSPSPSFPWFFSVSSSLSSRSSSSPSRVVAFDSANQWQLHFNSSKQLNKLMLVDFAASWCGPCKFIEPAVKEMACKYTDVDFAKIDVDELSIHHTFAATGSDGAFNFWDKDSKQRLKAMSRCSQPIPCSGFNQDGSIYAYAVCYDWSKGAENHNPATAKTNIYLHLTQEAEVKGKPRNTGGRK